ncbi:peptidyl-prolyl cis-trans isomerase SurA [Mesonia phycicola]|uniref:Peptidyl-prolyl cis-trans isomerase SurA n=1 Tax=Mesonia phycicola TaxID=579105 RepID=A0A1M6A551_9FLAO|nr:peptidylprolyl isomerase [Mesonia phycicola]SHI31606.1 peptidyl-prolyl cis-trans isomerase SurA [Mesonia phycicola]
MKKLFLLLPCLFVAINLFAQQSKDVLLTIDSQPVYAEEFSRVFSKNLSLIEEEEDRDVDEYLNLFIDYKLKVLEAEELKLDTLPTFKGEYNIYKKQLARKFINQSEASTQLLEEAYARLKEEVNASHILFMLKSDASPADTLAAYKKAIKVRTELLNTDQSFAEIAKKYSEDPSAQSNGGDLGWFGVFNMVYPFESGAYNTKIGEISMPVRSSFGYHLIKVNGRRKDEGMVTIAHIMIESKNDDAAAEKQINQLYKQLQEGALFEDLAKQYSADKNTAVNGGKLSPFPRGRLNSEIFENAAFALTEPNQISKPIKTKFGWHIIKLIEKDVVGSFEEEKFKLEKDIKQDSRSKLIESEVLARIKSTYNLIEDDASLSYFKNNLKVDFSKEPIEVANLKNLPKKNLIAIKQEGKTYEDFANYLVKRQKQSSGYKNNTEALIDWYNDFKNNFYRDYHRDNLEDVDPDYANVIEEYRNGLLLFDLMEKKVWNAAKSDSVALQNYYNQHQSEFKSPITYNGTIASAANKAVMKSVRKDLKKKELQEVEEAYQDVIFNSGEFTPTDSALPNNFKAKKGVSKLYQNNGMFVVIQLDHINKAKLLSFEEARGQVVSKYQAELEKNWINSLKAKHTIQVNQEVLSKLKQEFE